MQDFVAHTTVTADTPKLDLLGPVVQVGLDSGASRLNQVQFTLHSDSEARKDAIEKASAEAKAKAESVSKSMGVTLGKSSTYRPMRKSVPKSFMVKPTRQRSVPLRLFIGRSLPICRSCRMRSASALT